MIPETENILEVDKLITSFETDHGLLRAVDQVSFTVPAGKTVGIVGESGCGKSVTAMSIIRLLPQPAGKILGGHVYFKGSDLVRASDKEIQRIRGGEIGVIFQEPMAALNPVHRIGRQVAEVFRLHTKLSKRDAWDAATEMLRLVRIPAPEKRMMDYPHHLSGGMRQRVVIAMALACRPSLLIADEPTTALDVTVQAQILDLMQRLQSEMGMSTILITHDLGVIAETCDEVVVMYAGRVVEKASADELFPIRCTPTPRACCTRFPRSTRRPNPFSTPSPAWSPRSPTTRTAAASASAWAAPAPSPASGRSSRKSRPAIGWKPVRNAISHDPPLRQRPPRPLPGALRRHAAPDRRRPRGGRRLVRDRARRNAGPGRRVRLREIHARQSHRPVAQTDVRQHPFRANRHQPRQPTFAAAVAPEFPDDLPGSRRVARPADERAGDHRGAVHHPRPRNPASD